MKMRVCMMSRLGRNDRLEVKGETATVAKDRRTLIHTRGFTVVRLDRIGGGSDTSSAR